MTARQEAARGALDEMRVAATAAEFPTIDAETLGRWAAALDPVVNPVARRKSSGTPRPECWCMTCDGQWRDEREAQGATLMELMQVTFIVCPDCGNKRCPHATWHENACTGSNEPGQPGSVYGLPIRTETPERMV